MPANAASASPADGAASVALIRSRIKERRILEARFLCRQLVDRHGEAEKAQLEREVAAVLARAEALRLQAREYAAEGRHGQAMQLYDELEAIAVDMPGVAEEKEALAAAGALAARIVQPAPQPASAVPEPVAMAPLEHSLAREGEHRSEPEPGPPVAVGRDKRRRLALFPHGALALLLAAVLLVTFSLWRGARRYLPADNSLQPQARQEIRIQPLRTPPLGSSVQREEKAPPSPSEPPPAAVPPPEAEAPVSVDTLRVGGLQVRQHTEP